MAIFNRHGESLANLCRIAAGEQIDTPLSDKGRVQAFLAGVSNRKVFDSLGLNGDEREILWTRSRLRRTQETLEVMCVAMSLDFDSLSLLSSGLGNEGNFGVMTARSREEAEAVPGLFNSLSEAWDLAESNVQLGQRVMTLVNGALSVPWVSRTRIGPCQIREFVLHEGCNRLAIETLLNGRLTFEGLKRPVPNGTPVILFDDGDGQFVEISSF